MITEEDLQKGGIIAPDEDEGDTYQKKRQHEAVRYYDKNFGQNYTNILEILIQFLYDEFMISMVWIGLFDINMMQFNKRRIFWYIIATILIGLIVITGIYAVSLLSYIAIK